MRTHYTIDGKAYEVKRKGGRNKLDVSAKKIPASFKASPHTMETVKEQAAKFGMTESAYMDLACSLFRIDGLGNTDTVYQ